MQDNDEEEAHVKSARRVEVGWGGGVTFVLLEKEKCKERKWEMIIRKSTAQSKKEKKGLE